MRKFLGTVFGLLLFINITAQNNYVKTLLPDTFQIGNPLHFIHLSTKFLHEDKLEEAKAVIDFGFEIISKVDNEYYWASLKYNLSDYYYYNQNYDSAKTCYLDIIKAFETYHDTLMLSRTLNSIGILYSFEHDQQNTIGYYKRAIELFNNYTSFSPDILEQKLLVLTNIINHYEDVNEMNKVIEEVPKAVKLALQLGDSSHLGILYNALGTAHKKNDDFDKSLEIYKQASFIYETNNDQFRNAFILNNIGDLFEDFDQHDSAQYYFGQSLLRFEAEDYQYGIVNSKCGLAGVYASINRKDESRALYDDVIETALFYNFNEELLTAYYEKGKLEYDAGNFKEAYELNEKHNQLNDSLFNIEKQRQYAELKTKYETTKKENEINILKNERLEHENKLKNNKMHKEIGLSLIIFLLIFIYIIYLFYRQKMKANKLLIEKNKQIEFQNQQLILSNNYRTNLNQKLKQSRSELIKLNSSKNRFFSILAHDLRNPFHNVLGQSYLLSKKYQNLNTEEQIKFANDIYNSCVQVDRLLENLLEWSRTQTNEIVFKPEKVDIKDVINEAISVLIDNANQKNIQIDNYVDQAIFITADRVMIETIFRNLINNSIKFTPSGGSISINCSLIQDNLYACIEDNGVGLSKENINKIFDIDSKFKTRGTNNENGTGLGLVICKEFINYHKGKIWVESDEGKSTRFQFEIPFTF